MAAIKIRAGGQSRTAQTAKMVLSGVLRSAKRISVLSNGVLRVVNFTPALSAAISPNTVSGGSFSGSAITGSCTATPTGGLAPYSYAWSLVGYTTPGPPSALAPASATTKFIGPIEGDATFRVTITDSLGSTAQATVHASFVNFN